jgi:L,D-peptidoglycan transpeptidase YkuD (ErfK/YbiS/YcfS/YnhG family)
MAAIRVFRDVNAPHGVVMTLEGDRIGPFRAVIGRSGLIAAEMKREGDGATPAGAWPVRRALWRPDRLERPDTALVLDSIGPDDGWCDDPADPAYNRPVRLPWPGRHEVMTREDGLYDIVVVLGHNDDPPVPGLGSAIFLHCASPDYKPTEGCIAIARDDLVALLKALKAGDVIEVG